MAEQISRTITQLVNGATQLGSLNPCSIWALLSLCLACALIYNLRQNSFARRSALAVRLEEAKADGDMTNAIAAMANEIKELRHTIELRREAPNAKVD